MSAVTGHYEAGDEDSRMALDRNNVEWVRTGELLTRWLPPPPARSPRRRAAPTRS